MGKHLCLKPPHLRPLGLLIYGLPNFCFAIVAFPLALYVVPFYSEEMGLPLEEVGLALAASRVLDTITDPLIGELSDRTRSRWGRRKPWVALGAPLFMLSAWMVFVPGQNASFHYLLIWSCLLYLSFTLADLPYRAWGAELTDDYGERSRVTAWREACGFAGQIGFVIVLLSLQQQGYLALNTPLWFVAITVLFLLPPLLGMLLWRIPEAPVERLPTSDIGHWRGLALLLRNPALLSVLSASLLFVSGLIAQASLHLLVMTHVVGGRELFPIMLLLESIATLSAIPVWIKIADHLGKHRALALAALWVGGWSLWLPLCGPGDAWLLVVLLVTRGAGFASILFLANSMAADVVDYDTVQSGRQRTGLFFAAWAMVTKLAIALGIGLGTLIPASFGFEPAAASHSEAALNALMATYGWLPGALMTLGAAVLWRFPITHERQKQLRAEIAARRRPPR
ncbi:MAG: MFS transporter [bacterium]